MQHSVHTRETTRRGPSTAVLACSLVRADVHLSGDKSLQHHLIICRWRSFFFILDDLGRGRTPRRGRWVACIALEANGDSFRWWSFLVGFRRGRAVDGSIAISVSSKHRPQRGCSSLARRFMRGRHHLGWLSVDESECRAHQVVTDTALLKLDACTYTWLRETRARIYSTKSTAETQW